MCSSVCSAAVNRMQNVVDAKAVPCVWLHFLKTEKGHPAQGYFAEAANGESDAKNLMVRGKTSAVTSLHSVSAYGN